MINAGQMSERVTLQQPSNSVDALGQRVETWTTVATLWAQAQPLRGREYFAAGAMQSEAQVRFRIRWRAGVAGTMRLLWRGVPYAIVSEPIDVDGARTVLEIMASAGVRDAQ